MTSMVSPSILHLIASLNVGGTEQQLVQFINRSSAPERHVVAVFDEPGHLADRLPTPPVQIGTFGRTPRAYPGNARTVWALRKLVHRLGVHLVHAHLGVSEVLAALAVPRTVPLLASRRGRNVGFEPFRWLKLVEGLCHRRVDLMICNSNYLAEHTRRHDLWPPPIKVIHNAVDLERFRPVDLPLTSPPTVAMVANLKWYKRQEAFLRALRIVADEVPSVRALIVGEGPDRQALGRLTEGLRLDDNVIFAGRVLDPRPYVAQAHLVTLTSAHEGFPNALLEGMAMGRPVVATRVGGIPELVRDGVDGVLVDLDPPAIAGGLLGLMRDRAALERMSASAIQRAGQFTWDRVVSETESVYRMLAAAPVGKGRRSCVA